MFSTTISLTMYVIHLFLQSESTVWAVAEYNPHGTVD